MRTVRTHRGRPPSAADGWVQFGSHEDDGVDWLLFSRPQKHTQDWLTIKVVANGKALRKANYWLTVNLMNGKIAFSRDQLQMMLYREGLVEKVGESIKSIIEQATGEQSAAA